MNSTDQSGLDILPYAKGFQKKSQKFFEVLASRSPTNPFVPSLTYSKNQKTKSGKRITEESCIRSDVTVVIVFMLVKHHAH